MVGGGVVGCELAYSLAYKKDLNITLIEMMPDLMKGVVHANRAMLLWMMMGKGFSTNNKQDVLKKPVQVYTSSRVIKFAEGKAHILANKKRKDPYTPWITLVPENIHNPFEKKLDPMNTEEIIIDIDYVIFATGGQADDNLYYQLLEENTAGEIYAVGDAREPGKVWEAVNSANEVVRFI